jgi:predicted Zn-dependent protease
MAQKALIQFVVIAVAFFAIWFSLSRIEFINEHDVNEISKKGEKKLAELVLEGLNYQSRDFDPKEVLPYIDSIGQRICKANNIVYDSITVHIIRSSEVNAFALPDRHLVIYTGLLEDAKNAEEVAGVMAHEIGHMEKGHVMKKLGKEIGMSMIFLLIGGSENLEVIKEAGRVLSSTAFDRSQEQEADDYAVEAMAKAEIDVEPLGNFLFRLSTNKDLPDELVWISTHPDSKERAAEIFKKKKQFNYTPVPALKTPWQDVVSRVKIVEENNK